MKRTIVCLAALCVLAGVARAQFANSASGSTTAAAEINAKPAFQLVSGDPNGATSGTAGKDLAFDLVGRVWYLATVSGSPATWVRVEQFLSFSAGLTRSGNAITCAVASGSVAGCLSSADWTTFSTKANNPMTTAGDIVIGGSSGVPTRLAAGVANTVLLGNGAGVAPSYGALPAHATSHKNGGADEVGTATPAANVIPKTGSGGTLAIGFLATGTPTGSKFLRDDGTLAVPSGGGDMTAAVYHTTGAGAPSNPCATAGVLYRNSSTTPYTVYLCPSAGGNWLGPFATYDATKSGAVLLGGLTSGSSGFAAADIAGTAILYVMPTTNGTAGQVLSDSGVTTCPTLAAGMPTVCHQLTFSAGGGSTSPLTTKGDIWVYGTANARLPVGTNGQALVADSTQTLGLKFASLGTSATGAPYTQGFTTQTSVALTHNLALSPVTAYVLECFDGSGVKIQPGSETATNLNTVTVTFSVAQTGSCTVATGGAGGGSPAVGAITGAGAAGHYPRSNGSIYVDGVIQVADVPTLNQNSTGTAGAAPVFAGSRGLTVASSATPAFSFAASSSKSPTVIKFTPTVNVTAPTFTNLTDGARALLYITTDGTHTWNWNSTVSDNVCNVWTQSAGTTIAEVFVDPDGTTLHGGACIGGPTGLLSLVTEGTPCASNPASGTLCVWADSADHTIKAKDSSGNVTVLPRSAGSRTANQFVTHIPGTGIPATAAIVDADIPAAIARTIASGALALATSAVSSGACQTVSGGVNNATATGAASTDVITFTPNGSIKAVTGYVPATTGGLTITAYPTTNNVNFDVCNWTSGSITPGAVTVNWRVTR